MFLNSNPCRKTDPIAAFLNPKTPNCLKNRSLGIRILPHLEKSKLNLNLVDDAPLLDIVPWKLSVTAVRPDLTNFKKDTTNPEIYKQFYLQLMSEYPLSEIFFTDCSKTEEGVAAAAVSTKRINKPFTCRLPDDSSIYIQQTCLLFQRKIVFDTIWFFFIVTVNIKPKIWSSNLSSDFRILYKNDKRRERDCFYLGSRPCWH